MFIGKNDIPFCVIGGQPFVSRSIKNKLKEEFRARRSIIYANLMIIHKDCYYCGGELIGGLFSVDHKIPLSRGGDNEYKNLVLACDVCNKAKSWMTDDEFFQIIIPIRCERENSGCYKT